MRVSVSLLIAMISVLPVPVHADFYTELREEFMDISHMQNVSAGEGFRELAKCFWRAAIATVHDRHRETIDHYTVKEIRVKNTRAKFRLTGNGITGKLVSEQLELEGSVRFKGKFMLRLRYMW